VPAADGTRFLGLRSCGPIAVSTSIISRFGLRLGGSSTGRAVAGTVVGSIIPSIIFAGAPACAASEVSMLLDHGFKLLVRQVLKRIAVLDLMLARDQ
jgi:hypothetical protein